MYETVKQAVVFVSLLLLAAEDIKERQLSVWIIGVLAVVGAVSCMIENRTPGWVPGMGCLLFGRLTKEKIGYGDGWLILALGMWMSIYDLCVLLMFGMVFCLVYAWLFGKKELPFVPFLTAAYLVIRWL